LEKKENAIVIRCLHDWNGKPCNIPLCLKIDDRLIIKRHGREVEIDSSAVNHIKIVCERCKSETFLKK
jgi:hypothetical protein